MADVVALPPAPDAILIDRNYCYFFGAFKKWKCILNRPARLAAILPCYDDALCFQ